MAFSVTGRIEVLWLVIGEMAYVYYFVLRLGKGLSRLIALLPVLLLSLVVSWRTPTTAERTVSCFLLLWMIMFKLLLLAWDSGPAADLYVLSSFPRFFCVMTFSLHLKQDRQFYKPQVDSVINRSFTEDAVGRNASAKPQGLMPDGLVRRKTEAASGKVNGQASAGKIKDVLRVTADEETHGTYWSWIQTVATSQDGQIAVLRSVFHFLVAASLLHVVLAWKPLKSGYVLDFVLGFFLYFSCLFAFEGAAGIPACILGTQVHPQFNMPFLADSLADFWGRRWNLLINNLLRVSVYEPMLRFVSGGEKPSARERAISTASVFLVSGLMHELIYVYYSQSWPSWEMTTFFVVNGAATILEGLILKPKGRISLPKLIRRAYTLSFVYFTARWFFFPPLFRNGVMDVYVEELQGFVDWIKGVIVW